MAADGLHISLAAEPIASIGDFAITNSMFTSMLVSAGLIIFAVIVKSQLKDTDKPQGVQNFAEWLIEKLYDLVYSVTGDTKKAGLFLPLISTFFLFILLNNWLGLLPGVGTIVVSAPETETPQIVEINPQHQPINPDEIGSITSQNADGHFEEQILLEEHGTVVAVESSGETEHATEVETHSTTVPLFRPGTADLNTTLALGIISIVLTQLFGVHFLHLAYFKKFFNFTNPIMFFVGILELVSEVAKIISFAFRLFGNIFAGEVLLVVITYLTKIIAPIPFYGLEIFVGFIQALVFAMLSLVFFNMATESHEEH